MKANFKLKVIWILAILMVLNGCKKEEEPELLFWQKYYIEGYVNDEYVSLKNDEQIFFPSKIPVTFEASSIPEDSAVINQGLLIYLKQNNIEIEISLDFIIKESIQLLEPKAAGANGPNFGYKYRSDFVLAVNDNEWPFFQDTIIWGLNGKIMNEMEELSHGFILSVKDYQNGETWNSHDKSIDITNWDLSFEIHDAYRDFVYQLESNTIDENSVPVLDATINGTIININGENLIFKDLHFVSLLEY